jgi:alkylated DNA repair protein alkB family protein 8
MYNDFAETFSGSRRNHPWKEIDVILDSIPDGSSILDVGCGNGRFLEEAEKKGKVFRRYLGIDASSGMIHEARKVFPDQEFRVLSMESLGSIEETFDAIIFLASFHHLRSDRDRRETLREASVLLAP